MITPLFPEPPHAPQARTDHTQHIYTLFIFRLYFLIESLDLKDKEGKDCNSLVVGLLQLSQTFKNENFFKYRNSNAF